MAALRRLVGPNPSLSYTSLLPPNFLICCRGIASRLFVGAKIAMDRVSDRSKGFGFVTFASEDEAEKAIAEMNGKALNGRVIFVDYAKLKTSFGGGMAEARGPPEPTANK
ncbi:small RNA-binding protein 11, chloroplastic-like isoform X2 [Alnus glutinosa]|uniref:small RNA-binding protein 11, chloroplastic-like isoform X2 n=1 Tax=Alnus glutinosa TaxID=3517 RepID=UPI002D78B4D5|nr:small RNA-binding protein 11, chloroplastic-like isoform X2 [Alnus glutinosa]